MLGCLSILTVLFFFLTLYAVLQSNVTMMPAPLMRFVSFKILDTSSAATLFVSLLGALLVRHQFAVGLLPRINYKSANVIKTDALDATLSYKTWRVLIRNSGLGAAIVNRTEYNLELADGKGLYHIGAFRDIINELAKAGLVRDVDYWMENIANGFTLSPKDDCIAFEIKIEHLPKIRSLDMALYFQSQPGGKYLREISFVPHVAIKN